MNLKRVLFISLYNSVFYVTFELSPTWLTWSWIFENVMCKKQIIFSLFSSFSILQYFFLLSCAMFLWNWTFCVLPLSYLVHGIFFRFLRALQRLVFSQYSGYDFFGFYLKKCTFMFLYFLWHTSFKSYSPSKDVLFIQELSKNISYVPICIWNIGNTKTFIIQWRNSIVP